MTLDVFGRVANQLNELQVGRINLVGGEPLLNPEFDRIVRRVHSSGMAWKVTTNGTLMTLDKARTIAENDPLEVTVSIDGATQGTHGYIRGYGIGDPLKSIALLKANGVTVAAAAVLHRLNATIDELNKMETLLGELGTDELVVSHMRPQGTDMWSSYLKWACTAEQFLSYAEARPDILEVGSCKPGLGSVQVDTNRRVGPCAMYPYTDLFRYTPQVADSAVVDTWRNGLEMNMVRAWAAQKCPYAASCPLPRMTRCIQCQAISYTFFGDAHMPDPWCVYYSSDLGLPDDSIMRELKEKLRSYEGKEVPLRSHRPRKPSVGKINTHVNPIVRLDDLTIVRLNKYTMVQDLCWSPPMVMNLKTFGYVQLPSRISAQMLRSLKSPKSIAEIIEETQMDQSAKTELLSFLSKLQVLGIVDVCAPGSVHGT
jgi:MoaA/NifB/PqqE/SkfB family radical SAM enzyme